MLFIILLMIIGICGLQGSGKDTLGNIFVEKYGFKKLSFATILKDIVSILFSWDRNMIEGNTVESRKWREEIDPWWSKRLNIPNLTPRYVLQYFGTDLFRNHFHPEIWVAAVEKQIKSYDNIVITDCRFPNEIQMLKKYNIILIMVTRGELPDWFDNYQNHVIYTPPNIHPSEYLWIRNHFNYELENNGTIKDLEYFCDKVIKENK